MNKKVHAIAANTFKKVYNNPVIFILILACLALIGSTQMYKSLTMGLESQLMIDAGLALVNLLGIVIAIYLGATSISEEFEARTAHILLSKPVSRKELLIGKFAGTWSAAAVMVAILTIGTMIIVGFSSGSTDWKILAAGIMIIFQVGAIAAFAVMFSTFLKPTTATIATTVLAIILLMVYVLPGMAEGEYRIEAFGISGEQSAQIQTLVGDAGIITAAEIQGMDYSIQEMEEGIEEAEAEEGEEGDVPPAVDETMAAPVNQNYMITTYSNETRNAVTTFLDERNLASSVSSGPKTSMKVISSILPDLNHLSIKNKVGNGFPIEGGRFVLALIYGALLMSAFICFGLFLIEKKEIN